MPAITIEYDIPVPPGTDASKLDALKNQLSDPNGVAQFVAADSNLASVFSPSSFETVDAPVERSQTTVDVPNAVIVTNAASEMSASTVTKDIFEASLSGFNSSKGSLQAQLDLKEGRSSWIDKNDKIMVVKQTEDTYGLETPSELLTESMLLPLTTLETIEDDEILITKTDNGSKKIGKADITHADLKVMKTQVDTMEGQVQSLDVSIIDKGSLLIVEESVGSPGGTPIKALNKADVTHDELKKMKGFLGGGILEPAIETPDINPTLTELLAKKASITETMQNGDDVGKIVIAASSGVEASTVTGTQLENALKTDGRLEKLETRLGMDGHLEPKRIIFTNDEGNLVAEGDTSAYDFIRKVSASNVATNHLLIYDETGDGSWVSKTIEDTVANGAISTCATVPLSDDNIPKIIVTDGTGKLAVSDTAADKLAKLPFLVNTSSNIEDDLIKIRNVVGESTSNELLNMQSTLGFAPSTITQAFESLNSKVSNMNANIEVQDIQNPIYDGSNDGGPRSRTHNHIIADAVFAANEAILALQQNTQATKQQQKAASVTLENISNSMQITHQMRMDFIKEMDQQTGGKTEIRSVSQDGKIDYVVAFPIDTTFSDSVFNNPSLPQGFPNIIAVTSEDVTTIDQPLPSIPNPNYTQGGDEPATVEATNLSEAVIYLSSQIALILKEIQPKVTEKITSTITLKENTTQEERDAFIAEIEQLTFGSADITSFDESTNELTYSVTMPEGTDEEEVKRARDKLNPVTNTDLGTQLSNFVPTINGVPNIQTTVTTDVEQQELPSIPNPNYTGDDDEPETIAATSVLDVVTSLAKRVDSLVIQVQPEKNEVLKTEMTVSSSEPLTAVQREEIEKNLQTKTGGTVTIDEYDSITGTLKYSVTMPKDADSVSINQVKNTLQNADEMLSVVQTAVADATVEPATEVTSKKVEPDLPEILNSTGDLVPANNVIEVVQSLSKEVKAIQEQIRPPRNQIITSSMTVDPNTSTDLFIEKIQTLSGGDVEIVSKDGGVISYEIIMPSTATPGEITDLQTKLGDSAKLSADTGLTVTEATQPSTPTIEFQKLPEVQIPDVEKVTTTVKLDIDFYSFTDDDKASFETAYKSEVGEAGEVTITYEEGSVIATIDIIIPAGSDQTAKDDLIAAISDPQTILSSASSQKLIDAADSVEIVTAPVITKATKPATSVLDVVREHSKLISSLQIAAGGSVDYNSIVGIPNLTVYAQKSDLENLESTVSTKANSTTVTALNPMGLIAHHPLDGSWYSSDGGGDIAWLTEEFDPVQEWTVGRNGKKAWSGKGVSVALDQSDGTEWIGNAKFPRKQYSWSCWMKFKRSKDDISTNQTNILDFHHGRGIDEKHDLGIKYWGSDTVTFGGQPFTDSDESLDSSLPGGKGISVDDFYSTDWALHVMTIEHPGTAGSGGQVKYYINGVKVKDISPSNWKGTQIPKLAHIRQQTEVVIIDIQDLTFYESALSDEEIGGILNKEDWKYALQINRVNNTSDAEKVASGPIKDKFDELAMNAFSKKSEDLTWKYWDIITTSEYKHGMFTHEHSTGRPFFGHGGQWIEIARKDAFHNVATSGSYNDLTDKLTLHSVATSGSYNDLTDKLTFHSVATSGSYNDLIDKLTFHSVATSGKYTDLIDKPTAETLGLGNVANKSEADMVASGAIRDEFDTLETLVSAKSEKIYVDDQLAFKANQSDVILKPVDPNAGDVLTYHANDGWIAAAPSGGGVDHSVQIAPARICIR